MFPDPLHDEFAGWVLGASPHGGGDAGEVLYLAKQVKPGDDDSFYAAFCGLAKRRIAEGDEALAKGHTHTARDCYLRAASFLTVAYHPLYGTPVDPRLVEAFRLQMQTFEKALALFTPAAESVDIPYEGTKLPAWLLRAPGSAGETRPLVIAGGGWDSTMVDNYFGIGAAALARGYHVLLADGPGQGRLLIEEGLPLRHDWEKVVTPQIDAALRLEGVDGKRIVYWPWSLGGYMAPRVAAFEHRLAAVIADPGQIDVGGKFDAILDRFHLAADALDHPVVAKLVTAFIGSQRELAWKIIKRGFWTNGARDLRSFLEEMKKWKLSTDQVAQIRTPMLVTAAESDLASSNAQQLFDAIKAPKAMLRFADADGAGMHCEALNRSMATRKMLDWLDDTLGGNAK